MRMILASWRRAAAAIVTAAVLAVSLLACGPRPVPPADGGVPVVTESSWTSTANTAFDILDWTVPAVRLVVSAWAPGAPATTTAILRALDIVHDTTLPGARRVVADYVARGGDRCAAKAAVVALTDSLLTVADTLAAAGWDLAPAIHTAIQHLGAVADALTPACVPDAGFTSFDSSIQRRLDARPNLTTLRPFPAIHPPVAAAR